MSQFTNSFEAPCGSPPPPFCLDRTDSTNETLDFYHEDWRRKFAIDNGDLSSISVPGTLSLTECKTRTYILTAIVFDWRYIAAVFTLFSFSLFFQKWLKKVVGLCGMMMRRNF